MNQVAHRMIGIALLLVAMLAGSFGAKPSPSHAQGEPAATHNNGWSFVDVARVGQNGFTQLSTGRAGPDGEVVVSGVRNGRTGLFRVDGGAVTEVATNGTILPGGLGTLGDVGAFSFQYAILPDGDVIFKARVTGGSLPAFRSGANWSFSRRAASRSSRTRMARPAASFSPTSTNRGASSTRWRWTTS